ncbi:unnamed protein product [Malus baccata var. baccata]
MSKKGETEKGSRMGEEEELKISMDDMLFTFATLTNSCKAFFYAPVAEIFLPFNSISHDQCESFNKEDMFISRKLYKAGDGGVARDLICTGCQLCGSPLELDSDNVFKHNAVALYCSESLNHLHAISSIYRVFIYMCGTKRIMHLSWSETRPQSSCSGTSGLKECSYYKGKKQAGKVDSKDVPTHTSLNAKAAWKPKAAEGARNQRGNTAENNAAARKEQPFEIRSQCKCRFCLDKANGRFEMVSVQLPCLKTK